MEKSLKELLYESVILKKTPSCYEELAGTQLKPETIEISRFNRLTDRNNKKILGKKIVDYKYINDAGQTMQVRNSRVRSSQLCVEYQLPVKYGINSFIKGVIGQNSDNCNDNYDMYISGKIKIPVWVPFDVDITNHSIGKRLINSAGKFVNENLLPSDTISKSTNIEDINKEGGSRLTKKYYKKRTRVTKKRRGLINRRVTRKRK